MTRFYAPLLAAFLVGGVLAVGCSSGTDGGRSAVSPLDTISPQTKADSVAYRLLEAHGADAWASAPYLRFDFGVETSTGKQVVARHFWDRTTGDYRVEWSGGPDSSYVAIVNVRDVTDELPSGTAYLNGNELTGTAGEDARREAYGRYVNDTYWLLAPLKVFDRGVQRTYVPDSSTAQHDVLHLTFSNVGLTPNDEYWLYVSTKTGRLDRWAYHLQGMTEKDPPQPYTWTGYTELEAPAGTVALATRKESTQRQLALLTTGLALPDTAPQDVFSSPTPILESSGDE